MSPFHLVTLSLILLGYFGIGAQYAALTPAWQAPDEPAHYNVIRQIAQFGQLPKLERGDYDQAYLSQLISEKFPAALSVEAVQYQDYQPPLYYLLLAPVFLLFKGALLPLRLASLLLGLGTLVFAYLAIRSVTQPHSLLPLLMAGFIAFIPQYIAVTASVNNDNLSLLLIAVGVWLMLQLNLESWNLNLLSFVLGLAFLTKVWAYVLAPAALVLMARHWDWRRALRLFLPALLMGALYWGRNWFVCGAFDVLCGQHHNTIVIGQPTTVQWLAHYGWWGNENALLQRLLTFTFDSFWGVFGWMGVFMEARIYVALAVFSVALGVTFVIGDWLWVIRHSAFAILFSIFITTLALYGYYNFNFVQHQGRYLFPALIPIGVAAAVSLRQWGRWGAVLVRRWPWAMYVEASLPFIPLLGMAALSQIALYRFILPALR